MLEAVQAVHDDGKQGFMCEAVDSDLLDWAILEGKTDFKYIARSGLAVKIETAPSNRILVVCAALSWLKPSNLRPGRSLAQIDKDFAVIREIGR